jgi:hypothetical protein
MPQSATTQYLSRGYTPYTPPGTSFNGIGSQLGGQFRQNPTLGSFNQMPQGNGDTYRGPGVDYLSQVRQPSGWTEMSNRNMDGTINGGMTGPGTAQPFRLGQTGYNPSAAMGTTRFAMGPYSQFAVGGFVPQNMTPTGSQQAQVGLQQLGWGG